MDYKNNSVYLKSGLLRATTAWAKANRNDGYDRIREYASRIEELNFKLKNTRNLRESDFLKNEIDVLESILGLLSDVKYGGDTSNGSCKC
jgi:hypothetical protein